jgi:hypothetical protein
MFLTSWLAEPADGNPGERELHEPELNQKCGLLTRIFSCPFERPSFNTGCRRWKHLKFSVHLGASVIVPIVISTVKRFVA